MEEKTNLNTMLTLVKNMCEIMFHGNIESQDKRVEKEFNNGLNEYLSLQKELYDLMKDKGYYAVTNVNEEKIQSTLEKFEDTLV